jgi:S1-C subfamily serine protease
MNRIIKLILGISLFLSQLSFGQTYVNPKCNSQTEPDLKILRVTLLDNSTVIDFELTIKNSVGHYIFLSPPNTDKAFWIKANNETYRLKSTNGIGDKDGITPALPNTPVNFSATFEALPKTTTQFDLIEGKYEKGWCIYGIQLIPSQNSDEFCDNINLNPTSKKPEFNTYLKGVKRAIIVQEIAMNADIIVINALQEYLTSMGFESVETVGTDLTFQEITSSITNLCEVTLVEIGYQLDLRRFFDIKMKFTDLGTGYEWEFSTNKTIKVSVSSDLKGNFGLVFREMYGYKKDNFNSYYTLKLASRQTCWTEAKLKNYIQSKGCDKIEGIYENTGSSDARAKYKVAVRKISGIYYLIYLSGANNTGNWSDGEIKATLEPTATPLLFKAKWVMSDKSLNNNFYLTFEQGLFNLLSDGKEKELYIKLFPSATDNFSNTPSESASSGTGYAISSDGYIVTNHHVTNGATSIKVRGVNGDFSKTYSAKVIIEDKNNDLSIIKIDDLNFNSLGAIPYVIANRASDVGTSVFVLGYPLRATMGDEVKLTNGIISSKSGFQGDVTSYQITAPVQPGNSGGPLFEDKGNIIGIINAKHTGAENASYAIKSSYLFNLIDLMPTPPKLQTISSVTGKTLTEQVKILKKFTYILEIN